MARLQVRMLKTRDQLQAGTVYNLPCATAMSLVNAHDAELPTLPEAPTVAPTETKPAAPSEIKAKKKQPRARTVRES